MPSHTHQAKAYYDYPPTTANPASCFASSDDSKNIKSYIDDDQNHVPMSVSALQTSGNNVAHENRQPYLVVPFCIALVGMYPSRP
jgi:microcystin-dependent protein